MGRMLKARTPWTPRTARMQARTPVKSRRATPRRSGRVRDAAYMAWVRTLTCAASAMDGHVCEGAMEADHVGARGLGQKCSDRETIALCSLAHRQRTDFAGPFRSFDREQMRAFVGDALARTAAAWAAANPTTAADERHEAA
jgi:hypothetical protein